MKFMPGFTDFFMSPVTGRIILPMFPDLTDDYIWIGGFDDRPIESPALIDLRLEILDLRNRLEKTHFILQHASSHFDNSQALDQLIPGILWQNGGIVSIAHLTHNKFWIGDINNYPVETDLIPIGSLPDLPYHNIWIGDETNRPVAQGRIWDDGVGNGNLPAYTPDQYQMIWRMNNSGIPILVNDLTSLENAVSILNGDITSIFSDIASIFSSIADLVSKVNSILSTISTILGQIDSILSSIASILDTISGMEITITTIEEEITTIDGEITDIYSQLDTVEAEIVTINDTLATIEGEITTIEGEITTIEGEIAGIEAELITIEGEIATMEAEITALTADVATLDADVATLDADVATLDAEVTALTDAVTVLNTEMTLAQDQILALQAWQAVETEDMIEAQDNITTLFGLVSDPITLTGDVTGTGYLNVPIPTTLTLTLDQIPLAAANVNLNGHEINSLAMAGSPAGTDAVNVNYLNSIVDGGTVILTGDVTGSGYVNDGGFATTLTLHLNQIPAPTGNVNMNSYQITNLTDPTSPQDAATQNYVDTYVDSVVGDGIVTLTGNVLGSGAVGTSINTDLNSNILTTTGDQTFSYPSSASSTAFALINTFDPTLLTPSNMEFTLENSIGAGFQLLLTSSYAGGTFPDGVFQFYAFNSSGSTLIYQATSDLVTFNIPVTMTTDMSMAANKITNVLDPVSAQDAATKNYVDTRTITLTGAVTGSGDVGTSIATTLTNSVPMPFDFYTFSAVGDGLTVINNATPILGTDTSCQFAILNSVDNGVYFQFNTTYSGGAHPDGIFQVFFHSSTTTTSAYNIWPTFVQFVMPVTMLQALDMSTNLINNVLDPVSAQDAATKNYVDSSTITMTGDVTGSGFVYTTFVTTLTLTLDQIPLAAANVNLNSHQINNLTMAGSPASTDAANVNYVNSQIGSGTVILTGAVTGSGHVNDGGFSTTLASTVNMASGGETFSFGSTVSSAAFTLLANYVPTSLTPGNIELVLQNQRGSGFQLLLDSSYSGGTYPDGRFEFYAFTSTTSTQIYKCDSTLFTFNIPVTINNTLSMASNNITNVLDPVSYQDAATKYYVDSRTVTLTGDVTGINYVGLSIPTTLSDLINKANNDQIFSYAASNRQTGFTLLNNYIPNGSNASYNELVFENNSSKFYTLYHYTDTSNTQGLFVLTDGTTSLFQASSTLFSLGVPLDMGSHKIINLATPTLSTDATTKAYVDALPSVSGAFSIGGALNMNSHLINNVTDPSSAQDAATKHYVDTKTLDTFTAPAANLSLNSHKIINLATPTLSTDATTKAYVDALASVSGAFSIGGALNMNSHLINNVTDPVSAQDAATKNYHDSFRSYGIAYCSNPNGTTHSVTANTWTSISNIDSSFTQNFSLPSNNTLKYTGSQSVIAFEGASLSFSISSAASVYIGISINGGTPSANHIIGPLTCASGTNYVLTHNSMDTLSTNTTLSLYVFVTASVTLTSNYASLHVMTY